MTFYSLKPIDWLMADFVQNRVCVPGMSAQVCAERVNEAHPQYERKLFQHVGKQ